MRSIFTMFAEDVGLLPGEPFRRILDEVGPWQFHGIEMDAWPREIAEWYRDDA